MTIEIRNFSPPNGEEYVPTYTDLQFDVVGLDSKLIDIGTLNVLIETDSHVDALTHEITYTTADTIALRYWGDSAWYKIIISPNRPFDMENSVTIKINVSDTLGVAMTEYETTFATANLPLIKTFRYAFLDIAERIPIYNEQLRKESDTAITTFNAAFRRWNKNPNPIIRKNSVITSSGYSVDYDNGKVVFSSSQSYNDVVDASYTFAFFTDDQIESYFARAAAIYQIAPPFSGASSIYEANGSIQTLYMVGAASYAFRDLMFAMAFQEPRLIFDNASWEEGWIQVKDMFKGLAELYSGDWKQVIEYKKVKLPSIATIVIPEYTLPGGRSRFFRYLYKESSTF